MSTPGLPETFPPDSGFHRSGRREFLEFAYIVRFEDYEKQRELWQEERTVVFSRADANGLFTFDSAASGISAAFADKVFAFDSLDEDEFVEFAYDRLLGIAGKSGDRSRAWLRGFLRNIPDSAKAKKLESMLEQR
jgi:hypothetical protein